MFEGAKILNFTLHHIISAKGVTAAKVRGRKYIKNRGCDHQKSRYLEFSKIISNFEVF